ncbi:unnamed protein product [Rhizophagus irregularis]|uniref:HTH CENPB-type domain-containing protein n=3 Tax=Rhizophagus irregularis TaxID=588596 RepID=A0A915ZXU4_9GLOM|nr:unnamed protein product [Rhizophagus irregularis]
MGVRVDESTITRILKSKNKRLGTEIANPEAKRHKSVLVPELELALKEFVLNYQHKTILSDGVLTEKAKQLADELNVPQGTLQFSSGWLQKFKDRNNIRQVKLQGEADSADVDAIAEALPLIRNKCSKYPPERIYNMDETGLFYRLEPNRTLATQRLSGRKKCKERLSVALYSNADGSHKLKPLIIGKYANPRCFKNINIRNLPMTYQNNSKAWMLTTLFQEWLQEFDYQLENLTLSNVEVCFLPSNTTSKLQPMDADIIMWMLEKVEAGQHIQDLKMDVLQAIQYIIQSWDEVSVNTIRNCWNHTKILGGNGDDNGDDDDRDDDDRDDDDRDDDDDDDDNGDDGGDDDDDDDSVLDVDLNKAIKALRLPNMMQLKEFLTIPEENIVYEISEDEIISELANIFKKNTNHPDEIDDSTEAEIISINEALKCLKTLNLFLLQQENANEHIKLVGIIEKYIKRKQVKSMQQTTIDQYFR